MSAGPASTAAGTVFTTAGAATRSRSSSRAVPPPARWRLGIDYGPATSHGPGVGRYARELVRALVRLEPLPALHLLELARGPRVVGEAALGLSAARGPLSLVGAPVPRRLVDLLGRAGLGADRLLGGVDVFHDVRREPLAVSHARRTWAVSELPPPGSPAAAAMVAAARRMDALFAFSRHGAAEVARRLEVGAERVHVTPVGAEHFRRDLAERTGRGGLEPPANPPYVLVLGAPAAHRRPLALLAALERLRSGGLRVGLVLAGRDVGQSERLRAALARSPLAGDARWLEAPGEEQLPALIARASALCHLSGAELTPVTPLEALAAGVPVVASRLPAFAEALGDDAELLDVGPAVPVEGVDGMDGELPARLAAALERALAARGDCEALRRRLERAAPFTWRACAEATLEVWRDLAPG